MIRLYTLLLFFVGTLLHSSAQTLQEQFQAAREASTSGDYPEYLRIMEQLQESLPENSTVLYHLGLAQIKTGDEAESLKTIRKALYRNADLPIEGDSSFLSLWDSKDFKGLTTLKQSLKSQVATSLKAFQIDSNLLFHAEGIAYSSAKDEYFLGDIRKRQIVRYNPSTEEAIVWAQGSDLHSIMGLAVDDDRNRLWACSTPTPQMEGGLEGEISNTAFLLAYDLTTRQLIERYPVKGDGIWLGDLILDADGNVFLSSSSQKYPAIYRLGLAEEEVQEWLHMPQLRSMQGLVLSTKSNQLFVADYSTGLYAVSLKDRNIQKLQNQTDHPLSGIDGLYLHGDNLIAIHNGLRPFRVVSYSLGSDGTIIEDFKYLDKAIPGMNEPTLGVIVESQLYYVSNSPWPFYNAENEFLDEKRSPCLIRSIQLN